MRAHSAPRDGRTRKIMSDDQVNIEVDGVPMAARKGQMLMQVTDANDVYIPRFCYHEKLSIAANCRMCLVEIEKAPKPAPACATPVTEGMKVFTKSPKAIAAQKATMEFLLINHPLDCPICDQGGECELQDLAMGFGRDVSRYSERKRVVKDKNLGPLVSTDMTRCIHCTRCVRFTAEIAGYQELGTIGRGESTEIGTYIERSVDHELSGNIIDLCPVGALNNKPYRYRARAWEMSQQPLVSPHDSVGTNLNAHVLHGRIMRIVPRANEAINETWIADRDRFGHLGLDAPDRASKPQIREGGIWRDADWDEALRIATERLGRVARETRGNGLGSLASPTCTLEEMYLLQGLARGLGSHHLDHRLRRTDFRDQSSDPVAPWLGSSIADVEQADAIVVIGSNLRKELPLIAHRVRKAALRGAKITLVNPQQFELLFPVSAYLDGAGAEWLEHLAALLGAAAAQSGSALPPAVADLASRARVLELHRRIASELLAGSHRVVLVGALAQRDPGYSDLRALAAALASMTGATLGFLAEGANTVGGHLAGMLPHRGPAGERSGASGMHVAAMLEARMRAYLLVGPIEPQFDIAAAGALAALKAADCVVALTPYTSAREFADVILPVGAYAETSGTYVNLEGRWQSFSASARLKGEARPGWKVLRVLANLLDVDGFDYVSSDQVRDEIAARAANVRFDNAIGGSHRAARGAVSDVPLDVPIYAVDAYVRRAGCLQLTRDGAQQAEDRKGAAA
jgi:NADH-quinone oxidoreductase subunit G